MLFLECCDVEWSEKNGCSSLKSGFNSEKSGFNSEKVDFVDVTVVKLLFLLQRMRLKRFKVDFWVYRC